MSTSNNSVLMSKDVSITAEDLPLACPTPQVALWNMHPKVYLAIKKGQAICPYCGTRYKLLTNQ